MLTLWAFLVFRRNIHKYPNPSKASTTNAATPNPKPIFPPSVSVSPFDAAEDEDVVGDEVGAVALEAADGGVVVGEDDEVVVTKSVLCAATMTGAALIPPPVPEIVVMVQVAFTLRGPTMVQDESSAKELPQARVFMYAKTAFPWAA